MKKRWKWKAVALLVVVVLLYKGAQKICWHNNFTVIAPPSLDSWDPTERVEAARLAVKKFGGKQ